MLCLGLQNKNSSGKKNMVRNMCVFWLCLKKRVPDLKKVNELVWVVRRTLKCPVNENTQEQGGEKVSQEMRRSEKALERKQDVLLIKADVHLQQSGSYTTSRCLTVPLN